MIDTSHLDWPTARTLYVLATFVRPMPRDALATIIEDFEIGMANDLDDRLRELKARGCMATSTAETGYAVTPEVRAEVRRALGTVGTQLVDRATSVALGSMPVSPNVEVRGIEDLAVPLNLFFALVRLGEPLAAYRVFHQHLERPALMRLNLCREAVQWLMELFPNGPLGATPALTDDDRRDALWNLAFALQKIGRLRQAIEIWRELSKEVAPFALRASLAIALAHSGALREGESEARAALLGCEEPAEQILAGYRLAEILSIRGRDDEASALYDAVSAKAARLKPHRYIVAALVTHAHNRLWHGAVPDAEAIAARARRAAKKVGEARLDVEVEALDAHLQLAKGDHAGARHALIAAIATAHASEYVWVEIPALIALGTSYTADGAFDQAGRVVRRAISMSEQYGFRLHHAAALLEMAEIHIAANDANGAAEWASQAFESALCDGVPHVAHQTLTAAGELLDKLGRARPRVPSYNGPVELPPVRDAAAKLFDVEIE